MAHEDEAQKVESNVISGLDATASANEVLSRYMDRMGPSNNSPREGHVQSADDDVEQQQLQQHYSSDTTNCHDVDDNVMGEESNSNNSSSLEASNAAAAQSSSTTNNSTVDDLTMTKQRPRSILRQPAAGYNSSNTADDNNISQVVGAHQVNESAPNINRRFFNGLSNRNARMRAREERRLQREGNIASSSGSATINQQSNTNGEVEVNRNNEETTTSTLAAPPQHQMQTTSRRDLLTRMSSTRSLMEDDFNASSEFNSSSQSMSRMRSRRNLFSRMASNSNLNHDNNHNSTPQPATSRMASRRNLFSRMNSNRLLNNNGLTQSIISQTHSITATLVEDDDIVIAEPFFGMDNDDNANNNNNNTNVPLPDSEVGRIISRLEYRNTHRVPVSSDVKGRFLRLCDEACVSRVEKMREIMDLDDESEEGNEEEEVDDNNASVGSSSGSSSIDGSESDNSSSRSCSSSSSQDTDTALKPTNNTKSSTKSTTTTTTSSPCILREDIIQIRNTVRLAYESRTNIQRFQKLARSVFGFRDVDKALLNVLNRAVDSIDESGHVEAKKRRVLTRRASVLGRSDSMNVLNNIGGMRQTSLNNSENLGSSSNPNGMLVRTSSSRMEGGDCGVLDDSYRSFGSQLNTDDDENNNKKDTINNTDEEWFYYKDFAFYNLKVESKYPWVRSTGLFSLFVTMTFLFFTPILWCVILRDEK